MFAGGWAYLLSGTTSGLWLGYAPCPPVLLWAPISARERNGRDLEADSQPRKRKVNQEVAEAGLELRACVPPHPQSNPQPTAWLARVHDPSLPTYRPFKLAQAVSHCPGRSPVTHQHRIQPGCIFAQPAATGAFLRGLHVPQHHQQWPLCPGGLQ